MSDAYTSTLTIQAPPDRVFEYVRVPENQPAWAVNFVKSTRLIGDGRYVMQTPVGEMRYGEFILPARVVPLGPGAIFMFTILRTPGMTDQEWERGRRGLDEELAQLRALLER